MNMLQLTVVVNTSNKACPLCREGVAGPLPTMKCEECDNEMHTACFEEFKVCGAMECTMGRAVGQWLEIDGERFVVETVHQQGAVARLVMDDGTEWYVADTRADAVEHVRELMDDRDLSDYIDTGTLVEWGLAAMRGETGAAEAWLDDYCDSPEYELASYDGTECSAGETSEALSTELGWEPETAYRYH